jgi:hypothetical protein
MLGDYSLSDVRARMSPSFSDAVIIFPGKKLPAQWRAFSNRNKRYSGAATTSNSKGGS